LVNRNVYQHKSFTIYTSSVGADQFYLIASVTDKDTDHATVCREIYKEIADIISKTGIQIIQEKIYGSNCIHKDILKAREHVLRDYGIYEELPITYIQGEPLWGTGFSGVQICAVNSVRQQDNVWTLYENGIPRGRGMNRNGTTFLLLQNMHGLRENNSNDNNRAEQVRQMFDKTNKLLRKYGADYRDVVCTRIYISDILDWYNEFNSVRNAKYAEYGILPTVPETLITEQIYLPSSTGIQAENPEGAEVLMNVLAVVREASSPLEIMHNNGVKQRSAYRYGSAFSRSIIIRESNNKCIILSGTAAINEQGKSMFNGNFREQMRMTLEIVSALISKEGASLKDICLATVFLKYKEDTAIYKEVANEYGLADMPAVCVIADICRDELLFELEAIFTVQNSS
jgi:enamine deaminase RidA (YjgF/YER057c/UK114 family)